MTREHFVAHLVNQLHNFSRRQHRRAVSGYREAKIDFHDNTEFSGRLMLLSPKILPPLLEHVLTDNSFVDHRQEVSSGSRSPWNIGSPPKVQALAHLRRGCRNRRSEER